MWVDSIYRESENVGGGKATTFVWTQNFFEVFSLKKQAPPYLVEFPTASYSSIVKKVIFKTSLKSQTTDVAYWLSRSPEERIAAVELLRQQVHGNVEQRVLRVFRVVQLKSR